MQKLIEEIEHFAPEIAAGVDDKPGTAEGAASLMADLADLADLVEGSR